MISNCKTGESSRGKMMADETVCGVVATESVTGCGVAPGVIGAEGANVGVVPAGKGGDWDTPKVT